MDGSPLFKVVEDKSDSHKGVDYASSSLSSQCGELISWGKEQGKESQLISEMRERERQMRRQRDEALYYCGDIFLRAMQRLQVDEVEVSTGSGRARHSCLPETAKNLAPAGPGVVLLIT